MIESLISLIYTKKFTLTIVPDSEETPLKKARDCINKLLCLKGRKTS